MWKRASADRTRFRLLYRVGLGAAAALVLVACPRPRPAPRPSGALPDAVRRKVCASTCGGPHASIQVFRDAQRRIGALRFDGAPDRCSHPASIYFDPRGRQREVVPFKPVVKGSPEHRKVLALHARNTRGLQAAEVVSCKR